MKKLSKTNVRLKRNQESDKDDALPIILVLPFLKRYISILFWNKVNFG
ncbi:MAG: hypothetical protein ACTJHT_15985 [Sphingobacterium sp.]|nr:hypothetical protein [Sphingobacterium sp. JB170]